MVELEQAIFLDGAVDSKCLKMEENTIFKNGAIKKVILQTVPSECELCFLRSTLNRQCGSLRYRGDIWCSQRGSPAR